MEYSIEPQALKGISDQVIANTPLNPMSRKNIVPNNEAYVIVLRAEYLRNMRLASTGYNPQTLEVKMAIRSPRSTSQPMANLLVPKSKTKTTPNRDKALPNLPFDPNRSCPASQAKIAAKTGEIASINEALVAEAYFTDAMNKV